MPERLGEVQVYTRCRLCCWNESNVERKSKSSERMSAKNSFGAPIISISLFLLSWTFHDGNLEASVDYRHSTWLMHLNFPWPCIAGVRLWVKRVETLYYGRMFPSRTCSILITAVYWNPLRLRNIIEILFGMQRALRSHWWLRDSIWRSNIAGDRCGKCWMNDFMIRLSHVSS